MNLFLNKIKTEKKEKDEIFKKELKIELVKIKYANTPNKLQCELKKLNKFQVIDKNLHEIKQEFSGGYAGDFEMVGRLKIGNQIRTTHIRFRNITDYEAYIFSIGEGYDAEDAIFNGCIYKINTSQFNLVIRSQYGNGCDFEHEIIEYRGNNCYIPIKGYCFVKCINYLTGIGFKQEHIDFIWKEKTTIGCYDYGQNQPCFKN